MDSCPLVIWSEVFWVKFTRDTSPHMKTIFVQLCKHLWKVLAHPFCQCSFQSITRAHYVWGHYKCTLNMFHFVTKVVPQLTVSWQSNLTLRSSRLTGLVVPFALWSNNMSSQLCCSFSCKYSGESKVWVPSKWYNFCSLYSPESGTLQWWANNWSHISNSLKFQSQLLVSCYAHVITSMTRVSHDHLLSC